MDTGTLQIPGGGALSFGMMPGSVVAAAIRANIMMHHIKIGIRETTTLKSSEKSSHLSEMYQTYHTLLMTGMYVS